MERFSVTVIVGATNESDALKQTVETVLWGCAPEDIDKILIVRSKDASPGCLDAIGELEKVFPGVVRGMVQTRPGIGGAIRDGFDAAGASHLLLLPGDLAIGLDAVPAMIEAEKRAPRGIVKTSRWKRRRGFSGYSPLRYVLNGCAQLFLRALFRTTLTDLTNPVQIMPTALYRAIEWRETDFTFLPEMILCPLRLGVPFSEVPAACYGRREGKSNNSPAKTAAYLKTALRIRFSPKQALLKQAERLETPSAPPEEGSP